MVATHRGEVLWQLRVKRIIGDYGDLEQRVFEDRRRATSWGRAAAEAERVMRVMRSKVPPRYYRT